MAYVVMALLAVAAGMWMTRPLWRKSVDGGQRRRAANVVAYRQRLGELEADQNAGLLDPETATGLRSELDARLVQDAEAGDTALQARQRRPLLAAAIAVLVLALGAAGYGLAGSWKVQQQIAAGPGAAPGVAAGGPPGSVQDMVAKLQERLKTDPEDPDGWAMLGRSLFVLEQYQDSAKAYAKANELTDKMEPDLLVNEGEALALARDRDLLGVPTALFEAAVVIAPRHGKALWYSGLAAEQAGDYAKAQARWTTLAEQEIPEQLKPILQERLAQAAAHTGTPPPAVIGAAAAPAPPPVARDPGDKAGSAIASSSAGLRPQAPPAEKAAAGGPTIHLAVSVKPELAAKIPPGASLFVFAKAASGPPMPLAVYRGQATELPRAVTLDDSMAMMPALKLSAFEAYTVTARVTAGGGVQAQSGDLQGSLSLARKDVGDAALTLVIDQVVP